jgi:hypothetical protein
MKFICPECKTEDKLERILRGVVDTTPLDIVDGEIEEGETWIDYDCADKYFEYYCHNCGYELPCCDRVDCYEDLRVYLVEEEEKRNAVC